MRYVIKDAVAEPVGKLYLEKLGDSIYLNAEYNGSVWHLLRFRDDGSVVRCCELSTLFNADDAGKLIIE